MCVCDIYIYLCNIFSNIFSPARTLILCRFAFTLSLFIDWNNLPFALVQNEIQLSSINAYALNIKFLPQFEEKNTDEVNTKQLKPSIFSAQKKLLDNYSVVGRNTWFFPHKNVLQHFASQFDPFVSSCKDTVRAVVTDNFIFEPLLLLFF